MTAEQVDLKSLIEGFLSAYNQHSTEAEAVDEERRALNRRLKASRDAMRKAETALIRRMESLDMIDVRMGDLVFHKRYVSGQPWIGLDELPSVD